MNSTTGKVDLMKIAVPLRGPMYDRVVVMSKRALVLANGNDRFGASQICSTIAKILEDWGNNEENLKPSATNAQAPYTEKRGLGSV